ncbi:MAG: hypothetical protein D3924_07970 [Candidatus Electrothrix sp. AR4]|nr:hypothetical protein [Candidatus Electrothrix sp. AR4]
MKNIFFAVLLFVVVDPGAALASWQDDFLAEYKKLGIDSAVENALADDISPNEILTFIISNNENIPIRKPLKALYCAGADRIAVREAGNQLGITVDEISVALEESIVECGSKLSLSDRDIMDEPASSSGPGSGSGSSQAVEPTETAPVIETSQAAPRKKLSKPKPTEVEPVPETQENDEQILLEEPSAQDLPSSPASP